MADPTLLEKLSGRIYYYEDEEEEELRFMTVAEKDLAKSNKNSPKDVPPEQKPNKMENLDQKLKALESRTDVPVDTYLAELRWKNKCVCGV